MARSLGAFFNPAHSQILYGELYIYVELDQIVLEMGIGIMPHKNVGPK